MVTRDTNANILRGVIEFVPKTDPMVVELLRNPRFREQMFEAEPAPGDTEAEAIALANEISSRVGSVAPGQFHRRGFHPTGLFAPFGITYLAGKLLGSEGRHLALFEEDVRNLRDQYLAFLRSSHMSRALFQVGRAPTYHQTDNSTAATQSKPSIAAHVSV